MLGKSVGDEFNDEVVGSKFVVVGVCEDNSPVDDDGIYVD